MPELMSSLPVAGVDGTLRRSKGTPGRAHLKTGSLRDVVGVAGYVLADSGRRYVVVAIVNHANANAARPALDAIVEWVASDAPALGSGSFSRATVIPARSSERVVLRARDRRCCRGCSGRLALRWRKSAQR